jgi:hypothetical protein
MPDVIQIIPPGGVTSESLKDYKFYIHELRGFHAPPQELLTTPYSQLDGAYYHNTYTPPRIIEIEGEFVCSDQDDLRTQRQGLFDLLNPYAIDDFEPVTLEYSADEVNTQTIGVVYERGLEFSPEELWGERVTITLRAPEPLWVGTPVSSISISMSLGSLSSNDIWRDASDGAWKSGTGSGLSGHPGADSDGNLYLGRGGRVYLKYASSTSWSTVGSYTSIDIDSILPLDPDNIYIGGRDTSYYPVAYHWDGVSWTQIYSNTTDLYKSIISLAIDGQGTLYAGTNIGSDSCFLTYNGSTWSDVVPGISTSTVSNVQSVIRGPDGNIYVGGRFTGLGADGVGVWNPSTSSFTPLGKIDDAFVQIRAMVFAPDGTLYVGRDPGYSTILTPASRWTGVAWESVGTFTYPTSPGSLQVNSLAATPDGIIYAGGAFETADGRILSSGMVKWNGSTWLPVLVEHSSFAVTNRLAVTSDGDLYISCNRSTAYTSDTTVITNTGSSQSKPTFVLTGTGRVWEITNVTSGHSLYFDYALSSGETITINIEQNSITSSLSGAILSVLAPGSNFSEFVLEPGDNIISAFAESGVTATISFIPRSLSGRL